jgi:hypothetical protein
MRPDDVDLTQLLAPLRRAAEAVPAGSAAAARARGDRQARQRTGLILAAVAVVVAGVTVPVSLAAHNDHAPVGVATTPPTQGPSVTATPTVAGSASPTPSTSGSSNPCASATSPGANPGEGTPLPPAVMLAPGDLALSAASEGWQISADIPGYQPYLACKEVSFVPMPDVCMDGRPYANDSFRIGGRWRTFDGGPELGATETATTFQAGKATAFMVEVRDRVSSCPTFELPYQSGATVHVAVLDRDFAGDESLLIYGGSAPQPPSYPEWCWAVVRVGDTVIVTSYSADLGSDPDMVRAMAVAAAGKPGLS